MNRIIYMKLSGNAMKKAVFTLMALVLAIAAGGQDTVLVFPSASIARNLAIEQINKQSGYTVIYSLSNLDGAGMVDLGGKTVNLRDALDRIVGGTGLSYTFDGRYVVIHGKNTAKTNMAAGAISGSVTDTGGLPLGGVRIEVLEMSGAKAVTAADGRFQIGSIPAGRSIVRISDDTSVKYREVIVPAGGNADVAVSLGDNRPAQAEATAVPEIKTTAYFVPVAPSASAFPDEAKTQYSFVPSANVNASYLPKAAVKTNILYLATTTLNVAAEFGLARHWTLDVAAGLNPWDLNGDKGGIRHGLVQPEVRYWFCNRFEKHFVGLHGIYGQYQIQNIDLRPLGPDLRGERYDGWGVGAGISYGYHLPMARRWGWEFTVGVGYIYLDYKKYNCGECDSFAGHKTKNYWGPTKAGISLIYMLR